MENENGQSATAAPFLNKTMYDRLKFLAMTVLPGVGSLYFGLAQIWNLPNGEKVVGTITVVDLFLGLLLGISTAQYNRSEAKYDGDMNVEKTVEGKTVYTLEVKKPEDFEQKKEILFKVNPQKRQPPRTSV